MGWSIGYDENWERDIGYGVPATCDHPGCIEEITRGLSHVCGHQEPYGGEDGCGLYFCHAHGGGTLCSHCAEQAGAQTLCPHLPSPDVTEWIEHKLNDPTWQEWRDKSPAEVSDLRAELARRQKGLAPSLHSDEDYLSHDPFLGDEAQMTCRTVGIVKAKKQHLCFSFNGKQDHHIEPGERYRLETARVDDSFWGKHRICLKCMDRFIQGDF